MGTMKSKIAKAYPKLKEAIKNNPKQAASIALSGAVMGPAGAAANFLGTQVAKKAAESMKKKKKKAKGTDQVKSQLKSGKLPKYNKKS